MTSSILGAQGTCISISFAGWRIQTTHPKIDYLCVCVRMELSEKITFFQIWDIGLTSSGSHDTTFTVLIFLRKKKCLSTIRPIRSLNLHSAWLHGNCMKADGLASRPSIALGIPALGVLGRPLSAAGREGRSAVLPGCWHLSWSV